MNFEEFSQRLDEIRQQMIPAGNSGDIIVGDALNNKLLALKKLEQLAGQMGTLVWDEKDRLQALKSLVTVRAAVESQGDLEAVQIKLGRILADAGGVKEKGDAYSSSGRQSVPQSAPSSRVNRIT